MRCRISRFLADKRGNFAVVTSLAAMPLLIAAGAAIDLAYAGTKRSDLQQYLDGAMLAAGKVEGTLSDREAFARSFLTAQLHGMDKILRHVDLDVVETNNGAGLLGTLKADYKTTIIGLSGIEYVPITVQSEVLAGSPDPVDVVMVLDSTASLGKDGLTAVKDAAKSFATEIFDQAPDPSKVQVGVVPFAGAVNVGRDFSNKMLDTAGNAKYHAHQLEYRWIAQVNGCTPNWGGGGGGVWDPGDGSVESSLWPALPAELDTGIRFAFGELLGVRAALAADPQDHGLPAGFTIEKGGGCKFISNPAKINHFTLFNGLKNVKWGGCVEARAEPYDTNDTAPNAKKANTLFVPYFWPDEPDAYEDWVPAYTNNYTPDATPSPWTPSTWATMDYWGRNYTITKYDGRTIALGADGQYKSGPNFACPDPVQPLTKTKGQVVSAIESMSLVPAGGTVISEGAAWGWRLLSPTAPFTEGSKDASAKRYMIVMSDGENQVSRNPRDPGKWGSDHRDSPTLSDYSAYGYLRYDRFTGSSTFGQAEAELDKRTSAICTNAKKAGVEVYTILFRSTSERAIKTLKECASEEGFFYQASDAGALKNTFSDISASIGRYRLTR